MSERFENILKRKVVGEFSNRKSTGRRNRK